MSAHCSVGSDKMRCHRSQCFCPSPIYIGSMLIFTFPVQMSHTCDSFPGLPSQLNYVNLHTRVRDYVPHYARIEFPLCLAIKIIELHWLKNKWKRCLDSDSQPSLRLNAIHLCSVFDVRLVSNATQINNKYLRKAFAQMTQIQMKNNTFRLSARIS